VRTEQALEAAVQKHQEGRLAEAQALYQQVLAQQPDQPDALHLLGVLFYQLGRPDAALEQIRRAVALNPAAPDYQINLGEILSATGRLDEAIVAYGTAARLAPRSPVAHNGLSTAFFAQGRLNEAFAAARRAIELRPDYPEAHNNLGNVFYARRELEPAIASYRRALDLRPAFAEAANNLGAMLRERGQLDEAMALFRSALALRPEFAEAHNNLGIALGSAGRKDEAIVCHQRAVAINPVFAQAYNNLGISLLERGHSDAAQAAFHKALELRPDLVEALNNLGKLLRETDLIDEAIATGRAALALRPDDPEVMNQLSLALTDRDQGEEASRLLRRAVALRPGLADAHNNLGNLLKDRGQLDEALSSYGRAVALRPDRADFLSNRIFCMQYHPDFDAAAQARQLGLWDQLHAQPLAKLIQPHTNDRSADRRLRVGYVSPDFREHCQSFFTIPVLSAHDHQRFEVFCYSSVRREDAVTRMLRGYADVWREAAFLSDEELASVIRNDRIDILVDLTMHMAHGRLRVFAGKPAPVQVTWLAYPGSTGLKAMDYRLTDPYLDPPGGPFPSLGTPGEGQDEGFSSQLKDGPSPQPSPGVPGEGGGRVPDEGAGGRMRGSEDSLYSEQSVRLNDTFWCYDPRSDLAVNDLPALRRGQVTFGCLNNFCKVNDEVLKLWARVLGEVGGSRLLILSPAGSHRDAALATLAGEGVDPSRVQWLDRRPRPQYLKMYHLLDVCLDTFPYNGHTTSLDAMWMGVPVVTRLGRTVVGRAGWSQLSNLNLTDLAAQDDEQFVSIAAGLAGDLPRLDALRRTLRPRMEASPLMDARRFARNMEDAYRGMWGQWLSGPASGS
jgi:predicted O-linked N-acetylglucosamine transferase (SPINDLY family)